MRDKLRRALGVDEDDEGFDDDGVDLLLNTSLWFIADRFKFKIDEEEVTDNTVAGTNAIALQSDAAGIQLVSIADLYSDQHTPLKVITLHDFETEYVDRSEARGKPTHYFRRGANIILWPTPDDVYEVTTYYKRTLSDLIAGGPLLPHAWDEIILAGGIWRGAAELGDSRKKRMWEETELKLMATIEPDEAKEKANQPNAGVTVYRPRYR